MRVLLDECLPRRLAGELTGHRVSTVQQEGWAGISNGKLLALLGGRFEAFITVDKNLPAQQETTLRPFGVVVLRAPSNQLSDLRTLVPQVLAVLDSLQPGMIAVVATPKAE